MTTTEALAALTASFPGVEFRVRQESQAFGTNYSRSYLSVSYNYKRSPIEPASVRKIVPTAQLWVRGRNA